MTTQVSKRLVLRFPTDLLDKPIIHKMTIDYDLVFNILKAHIIPNKEGLMVIEVTGEKNNLDHCLQYLADSKVVVEQLAQDIVRDDDACVHCGLCVAYCPSGALSCTEPERLVEYDDTRCIACEECVRICPTHAFQVKF